MPAIQTKNLVVQYRQAGAGSRVLVFLHGNYASSRWWLPQFERLPADTRAYAMDLRGCGSSEGLTRPLKRSRKGLTIADLARDLAEFIDALGIEDPILVGHSLGGVVATEYAIRYGPTVSGLVLENSGPPDGFSSGLLAPILASNLFEFSPEIRGERLTRSALQLAGIPRHGELAEDLVEDALATTPGQYRAFIAALARWDARTALPHLNIPTLLVWGEQDVIMPPRIGEGYARLMPDARLALIPDAGHSPHLEAPEKFSKLLQDFVYQRVIGPVMAPKYTPQTAQPHLPKRIIGRLVKLLSHKFESQ